MLLTYEKKVDSCDSQSVVFQVQDEDPRSTQGKIHFQNLDTSSKNQVVSTYSRSIENCRFSFWFDAFCIKSAIWVSYVTLTGVPI